MTVASLWKALDKAECGTAVGASDIAHPKANAKLKLHDENDANHFDDHNSHAVSHQTLAIDLSIWICESLTSHGNDENNANPALHLVFARTIRLLNLGLKLIVVIEGKSRIRDFTNCDKDKFRKRRSGSVFWNACNACEEMLKLLGIPVVRAKAEGEALCALLNQRGIVDAVISNDGDCLLFGAKVVYTKFSIENMDNCKVMRYDQTNLLALVDVNDDKDIMAEEVGTIKLSRHDLISFALLTGSDLVGSGFSKVGHKKAVRFIKKCHLDNPLTIETASLAEMTAWARASKVSNPFRDSNEKTSNKCCKRCAHVGSKKDHMRDGCGICGTEPGEPCFLMTSEDRFRSSLRVQAMSLFPKFDPGQVLEAYMRPNDNQLPIDLARLTTGVHMRKPNIHALMSFPKIIKGNSIQSSRAYVKKAIYQLLTRNELLMLPLESVPNAVDDRIITFRERPIPLKITKSFQKDSVQLYEIQWIVNSSLTDSDGNGVDGYEFVTSEPQNLVNKKYPSLVESFKREQKIQAKQGECEQNRRRTFLDALCFNGIQDKDPNEGKKEHCTKKRKGYFEAKPYNETAIERRKHGRKERGDDVSNLLRFIAKPLLISPATKKYHTSSPINSPSEQKLNLYYSDKGINYTEKTLTDDDVYSKRDEIFCNMGAHMIAITPIVSNQGQYPPRHIFVYRNCC